jgi:hypothetical protein
MLAILPQTAPFGIRKTLDTASDYYANPEDRKINDLSGISVTHSASRVKRINLSKQIQSNLKNLGLSVTKRARTMQ